MIMIHNHPSSPIIHAIIMTAVVPHKAVAEVSRIGNLEEKLVVSGSVKQT